MDSTNTYASAGVNIAAGLRAVDLMSGAVRATYGPEVLAGIGAFGGLYDAQVLKSMAAPVLVASTDGVGTKTKVAAQLRRWDTIGRDLVNHCINDILVQGAEPLFFLDYVASSRLDPEQVATVVTGVANACRDAGCALLGGETAEMPGVYEAGEIDLAGTIIGVVERSRIIDGARIRPGDSILGLPSTGLHTNGFSLARRVLSQLDWHAPIDDKNSIGDALLAVHRCYLQSVRRLWSAGIDIRGMAHITGGGFVDNLPRILPPDAAATIHRGTWPELPIFKLIREAGQIGDDEMFHVFNMGLGMLVVIPGEQVHPAISALDGGAYDVGRITAGARGVTIIPKTA
ncbi:MAG: phosphoribosylformylglycinamidine cyclo-ligase [Chloroflexi bacterium]|nr:phosphoribosylformylglycinamidine cyclo-ligase [Chloroflexota bacterium]MCL5273836.1 phosphoribosylformylglycinamidine cyclo-ligase [Chloroflexota bacterium]